MYKFPSNVRVTITKDQAIGGHKWEVTDMTGYCLSHGWTAGNKRETRQEAWRALESVGLVIDE